MLRSNSAIRPIICHMARPVGVSVSIASVSDRNFTPRFLRSSSMVMRSRRLKAAKHRGVKFGRKLKLTPEQIDLARKLIERGEKTGRKWRQVSKSAEKPCGARLRPNSPPLPARHRLIRHLGAFCRKPNPFPAPQLAVIVPVMPITPQQIQAAQATQRAAAHDGSPQIRLVAGPGTGKSFSIEERVCWLLGQGIQPRGITVVSFTRASSTELRSRIHAYCAVHNQHNGTDVRVSTLHSLALRMLKLANLLHYPADPLVLDRWELENVFDAEFGYANGLGKTRSEKIRQEHEAFWSTGNWAPPNYIPPDPPITPAERAAFNVFHGPRTQAYSCVLPGEIVRECLSQIVAGNLDPVALLHLQHLIVDEYQDLNPIDQQFVDQLIARGVITFVAGDDDQSIYSFRYGSPSGIQNFTQRYPSAAPHTLTDCFRCAHLIADAANALMIGYPSQNRIPKVLNSLYAGAAPAVAGVVHRWRFPNATMEFDSIAASCQALINARINPRDILILLSNQRELLGGLKNSLNAANVPFEPPRAETFLKGHVERRRCE
jgi:DNA helicase II / ATP-dependent DNA helicase PcrA